MISNDSGAIVGAHVIYDSDDMPLYPLGFLYSEGSYTEILPPGKTGSRTYGINNSGIITGYAYASPDRGFTATVVPEPISSILFIAGGAVLAGRRFLKKRIS